MQRAMPYGHSVMMGEMFKELHVEVHYSAERDLDDTLASFAEADGASVLSADNDFLRYEGASFPIFSDFRIVKGRLKLNAKDGAARPKGPMRPLEPKPRTQDYDPSFIRVYAEKRYVRGVASPLVRLFRNPHLHVRPLRQGLYVQLGFTELIAETFPTWNGKEVVWDTELVAPDAKLQHLLRDPEAAIRTFFPELSRPRPRDISAGTWFKHRFAVTAVVHELCCVANGASLFRTMLDTVTKW